MARETIRRMETLVLDDFRPDLTLILDVPVEIGLARTAQAARTTRPVSRRIRQRTSTSACAQAYLAIARRDQNAAS